MSHFLIRNSSSSFVYGDVSFNEEDGSTYSNIQRKSIFPKSGIRECRMASSVRRLKSDFFPVNCGYAVSERLANALRKVKTSAILHTMPTVLHDGRIIDESLYFLEISEWADGFDFDKSKYDRSSIFDISNEPIVRKCQAAALQADKLKHNTIFFLNGVALSDPVVSEAVAEAIQGAHPRDIELIKVEGFHWDI